MSDPVSETLSTVPPPATRIEVDPAIRVNEVTVLML